MDGQYLGTIQSVGFQFAPRGFAVAQGQLLAISEFNALFALIGTFFGGDGRTSFGVPDLRGRTPIGMGTGPGLPSYSIGEMDGIPEKTLSILELPTHSHDATFSPTSSPGGSALNVELYATTTEGNSATPSVGAYLAQAKPPSGGKDQPEMIYTSAPSSGSLVQLGGVTVTGSGGGITGGTVTNDTAGGSLPFSMYQPSLAVNFILCIEGLFPSRN
jgi:microcystin-dependent protein